MQNRDLIDEIQRLGRMERHFDRKSTEYLAQVEPQVQQKHTTTKAYGLAKDIAALKAADKIAAKYVQSDLQGSLIDQIKNVEAKISRKQEETEVYNAKQQIRNMQSLFQKDIDSFGLSKQPDQNVNQNGEDLKSLQTVYNQLLRKQKMLHLAHLEDLMLSPKVIKQQAQIQNQPKPKSDLMMRIEAMTTRKPTFDERLLKQTAPKMPQKPPMTFASKEVEDRVRQIMRSSVHEDVTRELKSTEDLRRQQKAEKLAKSIRQEQSEVDLQLKEEERHQQMTNYFSKDQEKLFEAKQEIRKLDIISQMNKKEFIQAELPTPKREIKQTEQNTTVQKETVQQKEYIQKENITQSKEINRKSIISRSRQQRSFSPQKSIKGHTIQSLQMQEPLRQNYVKDDRFVSEEPAVHLEKVDSNIIRDMEIERPKSGIKQLQRTISPIRPSTAVSKNVAQGQSSPTKTSQHFSLQSMQSKTPKSRAVSRTSININKQPSIVNKQLNDIVAPSMRSRTQNRASKPIAYTLPSDGIGATQQSTIQDQYNNNYQSRQQHVQNNNQILTNKIEPQKQELSDVPLVQLNVKQVVQQKYKPQEVQSPQVKSHKVANTPASIITVNQQVKQDSQIKSNVTQKQVSINAKPAELSPHELSTLSQQSSSLVHQTAYTQSKYAPNLGLSQNKSMQVDEQKTNHITQTQAQDTYKQDNDLHYAPFVYVRPGQQIIYTQPNQSIISQVFPNVPNQYIIATQEVPTKKQSKKPKLPPKLNPEKEGLKESVHMSFGKNKKRKSTIKPIQDEDFISDDENLVNSDPDETTELLSKPKMEMQIEDENTHSSSVKSSSKSKNQQKMVQIDESESLKNEERAQQQNRTYSDTIHPQNPVTLRNPMDCPEEELVLFQVGEISKQIETRFIIQGQENRTRKTQPIMHFDESD
ncbi:Hypothetical_protein [Hexamita inflata]|uniref:Hypothetical_protein n=1 Tax=Hexamita inflata TaxID=28002 RepID=A0AA86RM72_9EUKA|nr:Hypothetical protein HINF_LOCUS63788 [Hexamita inflata]